MTPSSLTLSLYSGMGALPHFDPDADRDPLSPAVAALRAEIAGADALLFCVPEYAGTLPGSFKNLLDWTVGGPEIGGKAVAYLNAASGASPTSGEGAHHALRVVLGYVGATIVEGACRRIPMRRDLVGQDGLVHDPDVRAAIVDALGAMAAHLGRAVG